jgi:hypothetical protein
MYFPQLYGTSCQQASRVSPGDKQPEDVVRCWTSPIGPTGGCSGPVFVDGDSGFDGARGGLFSCSWRRTALLGFLLVTEHFVVRAERTPLAGRVLR